MQTPAKLIRLVRSSRLAFAAVSLVWLPLSMSAFAQSSDVSKATAVAPIIPQQVRYTGVLTNRTANTVEAVFKIYATAEGGEPLWTETQRVIASADGSYSVLLGAASQSGLPQSVFAAGQARWVGVSIDGAEEGARSPLSSVAYAMKAGDAESVGGLSAANLATKEDLAKLAVATSGVGVGQAQAAVQAGVQPATNPTGSGTADYLALWTTSGNLGNSGLYQAASGFFGIGTTTPGGPLQLSTGATGGANATMMLTQTSAASGNYYADIGLYNSKGLIGNLSALGAGYPAGNLFVANDVVFLGGQQNAGTNLIFLTNTSGALKFGTGGFAVANERMRIGAAGGVSVGNSYVGTDPGAGNLIVSGKVGVGTTAPAAILEVNGTAKFDGLITFAAAQTFPGTGKGTITGVTASSPLTGGGTSGAVTVGLSTSALETTLNGVYAQLGASDTFADAATFSNGITVNQPGGSYAAVLGQGTNGATGVYGTSDTGFAVLGLVNGDGSNAVVGATNGAGAVGVYGHASGGVSSGGFVSAGVYALAEQGDGVEGFAVGTSAVYAIMQGYNPPATAGVWGDTSTDLTTNTYAGVVGTADDNYAGFFRNNSENGPTIVAENDNSDGSTGLFKVFKGVTPLGTCGIGDGNLSCTGQVKMLATTGGGAHTVETYAPQAAESWMEDYGTGAMEGGHGVVQIDPTFADTVTADTSYHVFLTPLGELKSPLYVTKISATSFEVREANGGKSSIGFDYKIVAKRRGYEAQRLVDVTDRFNAEQAQTKRRMPSGLGARGSKGVVRPRIIPGKPISQTMPVAKPVAQK
jgi:hypothetical protein